MQCSDCKGTGQYIGFVVTEDCRTCGGAGVIGVTANRNGDIIQYPQNSLEKYNRLLKMLHQYRAIGLRPLGYKQPIHIPYPIDSFKIKEVTNDRA